MLPANVVCVQGQEKMSKSDPNSAIFMEDSAAEVKTKIKKAFCPPEQVPLHHQCFAQSAELGPTLTQYFQQHLQDPTLHCWEKESHCKAALHIQQPALKRINVASHGWMLFMLGWH